jgi:peptidyl-prolyl cis-trans isomerase A (cyclophilin A)
VLTGQFLDGPVEGLGFRTATLSGTTGSQGQFTYRAGESVTFFIGGLELPSVRGAAVVTPLEVVGTGSLNDAPVVNMLVLLQSLDEDGDASNGIKIPSTATTAAAGGVGQALGSALTTSSPTAFAASQGLRDVLDGTVGAQRAVVAAQAAVDHFAQTLADARPEQPFVSRFSIVKDEILAPDLAFDRAVRVRFEGRNLTEGVSVEASGACTSMEAAAGAPAGALDFTCTPTTTGTLAVNVKAGTTTLHSYTGTVPEPQVEMVTSLGRMTLELNVAQAPVTSKNFLRYVEDDYYRTTVFHRVMDNFMVQGGGFVVSNNSLVPKGGTYPPIVLERTTVTGLSNTAGTIAMARTGVENSATSQFYINTVDNLFLNGTVNSAGYAVFGRVVEGVDTTLQALRAVEVQNNGTGEISLPLNPPVILLATRVR